MQKRFFEDIEKLRAFACILVFIQHMYWICPYKFLTGILPSWLYGGSGGVPLFFAISGFVITLSLIDKVSKLKGNFLEKIIQSSDWLTTFYKKRFFRIFPMIFVIMIICGLYLYYLENTPCGSSLLKVPFEIFFGTFNNSVDLFLNSESIHYKGIGPFWTLAIESIFYIIWPLVLILCKNNNQRAIVSLLLGLFSLFILNPGCHYHIKYNYYWTIDNLSCLFLGAFWSFLYKEGFKIKHTSFGAKFAIIFVLLGLWTYPSVMIDFRVFYYDIVICCCAIFAVMICVFCPGCLNFPYISRALSYLGSRSFSFYACQLTLANIVMWITNSVYFPKNDFSEKEFEFFQFAMLIGLLIIMAELLYRFVERPSRNIVSY